MSGRWDYQCGAPLTIPPTPAGPAAMLPDGPAMSAGAATGPARAAGSDVGPANTAPENRHRVQISPGTRTNNVQPFPQRPPIRAKGTALSLSRYAKYRTLNSNRKDIS